VRVKKFLEINLSNGVKIRVNWYLERRAEKKGVEPPNIPFDQILINIGAAVKRNKKIDPTNAGILFFGVEPQRFLPHSEVKLARFKGTTMTEFIDRVELHAPLTKLIDSPC